MQESDNRIRAALSEALTARGAQTKISTAIGVTGSTVMRWSTGEVAIPEPMKKLLRLFLFGEIPFEDIRKTGELASILEFTPSEWRLITILAARAGQEPPAWIRSQILAFLAFSKLEQTESGDQANPLASLPRAAEEGNDSQPGVYNAKPGGIYPTTRDEDIA